MTEPILLSVDDGLARITLNRPQRLNAFDAAMAEAFADAAVQATGDDGVRAVLLDAAGVAFCAGGDVVAMATATGSGAEVERLARTINRGLLALLSSSVPVVAAAHGTTAGGGLGVLLASDYAVVGTDSRIGSRYAGVGLTPDLSVTAQLGRAVGERRALQLLLGDLMLTGAQAVEWGLAAEAVDGAREGVVARAEAVARGWLDGASGALGQAKRLVRSRPGRTLEEQLDEEARTIGAAFGTAEAQARIQAFAARTGAQR
ncbi:MAG: enoyl-CoA hydratase/isomerase family protein [Arachnia sp.]